MARKSKKSPDAGRLGNGEEPSRLLPASGDSINEITILYRDYSFAQEQRKRMDLALGAYLRRALGWQKDLPEKERNAIAKQAASIAKDATGTRFETMVNAQSEGRACFDAVEASALKAMVKLASALPVWESWGANIRGFGAKSLAVIVAEAGDLANYPDKSKLWKRMGLAVMGDVRQGGLKKGSSAEAWIEHGYSPKRRSQMWNIGDTMIKAQVRKVKDTDDEDSGERTSLGEYGQSYLDRRAYELAREPEMKPIIKHLRAQRYMEKRLLRDLWKAWRRAVPGLAEKPYCVMPDAQITDAPSGAAEAGLSMPSQAKCIVPPQPITDAPQGAGEARNIVPLMAEIDLPPRQFLCDELHEEKKIEFDIGALRGSSVSGTFIEIKTNAA